MISYRTLIRTVMFGEKEIAAKKQFIFQFYFHINNQEIVLKLETNLYKQKETLN